MPFEFRDTDIEGVVVVEPQVFEDDRGGFMEAYKETAFKEAGIDAEFVQDNHSKSKKRVIRGLHYQKPSYAQAKLVRCIRGSVFDVAVDLRSSSPTFGEHVAVELSENNRKMLYIPRGFGHGFQALTEGAEVMYKVDEVYKPSAEGGIIWNDPDIGIDWPLEDPIVSEEDRSLQKFKAFKEKEVF